MNLARRSDALADTPDPDLTEGIHMATHAGRLTRSGTSAGLLRNIARRLRIGVARVPAHGMRPPLLPGERILVAARDDTGIPVVATTLALHHLSHTAAIATWQRLPWEEVGRVHWDRRLGVLTVTRFPGGPQRTVRLPLPASSPIPALVRERVAATEIASAEISLYGLPSIVKARRRPGTSRIVWIVLLADGLDPDQADVRAAIDAATRELRTRLGL